jgi:VWFA-related protein
LKRAAVLWLAAAPLQSQTPTIKVEVPTVVVDVIATDRKGHHVPGLTRERFKVFEDNVPQEIVSFTPAGSEAASVSTEPLPPAQSEAVRESPSPSPSPEPKRKPQSITLLIDLGDLQYGNLKNATKAAAQYVERSIAAGNQVSLYWVDSGLHLAVPFTNDKQRLLDALEKLGSIVPSGRFTVRDRIQTQAKIDDLFTTIHPEVERGGVPRGRPADKMLLALESDMDILRSWLTIQNTFQARAIFVALRALAVAYRDVPGRKSVVVFSEGFLHAPEAGAELQAVIDAGNRAGVAFYVIDASGGNSGINAEVRSPNIGGRRSNPDMLGDTINPVMGQTRFDWNTTLASDVHEDLGLVANATGGFLVTDTNDLVHAIERVELDGSESYTLVYHPTNREYNGAFRKIKVTLDTGNYLLRFRQGYWAIPPGKEVMMTPAAAQLLSALETGSRKSSFAPEVNAALVTSRDGKFAIPAAVSMPGNVAPFEKNKDRYVAGVTMVLVARDAEGQIVSLYERYGDLNFSAQERDDFRQKTFNLQGHVPVPSLEPLTVQAVVQFSSGAVGMSAPATVNPGASSSSPMLTSLVLANRLEQAACDADTADPLCIKNLRVYLPAHARFPAAGKLVVYFTALDLAADPQTKLPALEVTFALKTGEDRKQIAPGRIQAVPGSSANSLRVLAEFDLASLKAGAYILQADAEDTIRRSHSTVQAGFTVE